MTPGQEGQGSKMMTAIQWCVAAVFVGTALSSWGGSWAVASERDLQVRGLLDVVAHGNDSASWLNLTNVQDSNFDELRARVFLDGGTDRTRAFVQVLLTDVGYSNFRFQGGYVQHRILEGREIYLEAGKTPVHDGTWAPRTYSNKNPLLGVPLAYYYKSSLPNKQMPVDLAQLVAQRGRGQRGVAYYDAGGLRGSFWSSNPMLYDNCWDYGAYVMGAGSRFDWLAGVSLGAPGVPVAGPDTNGDVGLHLKLGYAPVPSLELHVSAAHGGYLSREVERYLPAGKSAEDYDQTLFVGSLEWGWRHLTVNSEIFFNHFETPLKSDGLGNTSYYIETLYKFSPGWYAALRWDEMRFGKVQSGGTEVTWDQDIRRSEVGVGYYVTRELLIKAIGQLTDSGHGWRHQDLLPAVQVSFTY